MTPRAARLVFLLVLVLRVAIAAQFRGNFDSGSYLIVADAVLSGAERLRGHGPVQLQPRSGPTSWRRSGSCPVRTSACSSCSRGSSRSPWTSSTAGLLLRLARDRLAVHAGGGAARRPALLLESGLRADLLRARPVRRPLDSVPRRRARAAMGPAAAVAARRRRGLPDRCRFWSSTSRPSIRSSSGAGFGRGASRRGRSRFPTPCSRSPLSRFFALPTIAGNVFLYGPGLSGRYSWRVGPLEVVLRLFAPRNSATLALSLVVGRRARSGSGGASSCRAPACWSFSGPARSFQPGFAQPVLRLADGSRQSLCVAGLCSLRDGGGALRVGVGPVAGPSVAGGDDEARGSG